MMSNKRNIKMIEDQQQSMTKHHKQTYCIFALQILDILESMIIKILYSFISDYHRMHGSYPVVKWC